MIPHLPTHHRLGFVWINGYEFAVTETPTVPAERRVPGGVLSSAPVSEREVGAVRSAGTPRFHIAAEGEAAAV